MLEKIDKVLVFDTIAIICFILGLYGIIIGKAPWNNVAFLSLGLIALNYSGLIKLRQDLGK